MLQDDRFDQEHRELLADVLLGDVDVYLRGGLDKSWVDGGKKSGNEKIVGIFRVWDLTFLGFLVFYTTNLVKPNGKDTIGENKRTFLTKNTVYFAQKKDYFTENKVLKQV